MAHFCSAPGYLLPGPSNGPLAFLRVFDPDNFDVDPNYFPFAYEDMFTLYIRNDVLHMGYFHAVTSDILFFKLSGGFIPPLWLQNRLEAAIRRAERKHEFFLETGGRDPVRQTPEGSAFRAPAPRPVFSEGGAAGLHPSLGRGPGPFPAAAFAQVHL